MTEDKIESVVNWAHAILAEPTSFYSLPVLNAAQALLYLYSENKELCDANDTVFGVQDLYEMSQKENERLREVVSGATDLMRDLVAGGMYDYKVSPQLLSDVKEWIATKAAKVE